MVLLAGVGSISAVTDVVPLSRPVGTGSKKLQAPEERSTATKQALES